ncbi:glycoside hydrolase family 9 protein [Sphingomonas sp. M1-B02]|uniref:glycoside hydrolase family 9 protein n=1 Tax=Sphingomonas sp. M1-B02 TaxID=3114300 RepID=UPI00223EDEEF|nr:glycoside hydrolase family 9 protein [Sphingomonas sp. S6-11]UZK68011.1 glycoside hydrolase family 9 protein [Sphingomonas sp. S6-11]
MVVRYAVPPALALMLATPAVAQEAPSPIRLNQLGLDPSGPKRAMLAHPSKAPLAWQLVDPSGKSVLRGMTIVHGDDAASGEHVHAIDLAGAVAGEGYRLDVAGQQSRRFAIKPGTRSGLARDALHFFYLHRAGMPIDARFAGKWARPAGHTNEVAQCVSGKDERGTEWPDCGYSLDVTGGWYDAGDQGKYVVNGGITLWTLLNAHEYQARKGKAPFADGSLNIPEAGNGVSDLLDEARYEIGFFLGMQVPEGKRMMLPVGKPAAGEQGPVTLPFRQLDIGGMVHHKVADRAWTELPTLPHEDKEDRVLHPPSTAATLNFAATLAQCARIWKGIDPAFAARCLQASERAWAAAKRNPQVYAVATFTGSGHYGDRDLTDEFYWAAAELYATTAKPAYLAEVRASPHFAKPGVEPGWPNVAPLGAITLATVPTAIPRPEQERLRAALVASADAFLAERAGNGYKIPYSPPGYPWGSTSNVLNRAMLLAIAHDLTGQAKYRDGVIDALDWVLGRNPLDRSFVTGYGARPMARPHHRFWAQSIDPTTPPPPPGVISGGPNSISMSDPVAMKMRGKCAPMTCWADEVGTYTMNEIAINWNAPLVWVASWLGE